MFERNILEFVRHAPNPSVHGFATLTGVDSNGQNITFMHR